MASTILIVEDDSFISTFLEDKLKETFQVKAVTNAAAARETLAQGPINLIVLDVLLPDENGFAFLEDIKKSGSLYKSIPVLILSNLDQPEDIERGKKLGAVEYLVKANQMPSDVVEVIKKILQAPA